MKTGHYGIDIAEEIAKKLEGYNDGAIASILYGFLMGFAVDDHTAFSDQELHTIGKFLDGLNREMSNDKD